jgi:2-polyprenyl-3-methyl-5-hydroxy-6-metoxy-1,4-benzoquinol methylase
MELMAPSLAERNLQPEWMDQPGLDPALHAQALRGLARLNRFSRSCQILWPPIRNLACEVAPQPMTVLDLASGAGDVTIGLWRLARRAGIAIEITGCDVSPVAVEHARQRAVEAGAEVDFRQHDAFTLQGSGSFDVVLCSLFLHHQSADQAEVLLRRMGQLARRMVLVNDLRRGRAGYALAWLAARLLTRSPVVHVDGPRSVAAAFTLDEALQLAERAGLHGARIQRRWPCRYLLAWRKDT